MTILQVKVKAILFNNVSFRWVSIEEAKEEPEQDVYLKEVLDKL